MAFVSKVVVEYDLTAAATVTRIEARLGAEGAAALAREDGGPLRRRAERRLIAAAKDGSHDALEQLFRSHWPRAYRAAYLVVHDAAAAEDIAQEAFLAAVRRLDRFDRRRPFGPWLHRIAVNRGIDWARARSLRREVAGEDAPEPSADPDLEHPPAPDEYDELVAALRALPPERRAAVVLRYVLDYTPGEIARMLELPRGTVNSRLRRALDTLAEGLGGERR